MRINFRFKRPEVLPVGAAISLGSNRASHQFRQLIDQLSKESIEIIQLRKSIQRKNKLICQFKNFFHHYETFFREEISLFQLQRTKIILINQTYLQLEKFIKDIDNQLNNWIEISPNQVSSSATVPLKRILLRFLHQKDFYHQQMERKLKNIDETIRQKQQLLDELRQEISEILEQTK
ncbi:MAG: hypothetical protein GXO74_06325 [Calditrichaeota bacterium]|nr:hypothetical protein [Calditrichota bacterium]